MMVMAVTLGGEEVSDSGRGGGGFGEREKMLMLYREGHSEGLM